MAPVAKVASARPNDSRAPERRSRRPGYDAAMERATGSTLGGARVGVVRGRIDAILRTFLADRRAALDEAHPVAARLGDELSRVIDAGGKRLRPLFCYWGFRAAGGADGEAIVRAAASLELLHTFAIIHD